MTAEEMKPHVEFVGVDRLPQKTGDAPLPNVVIAIGHFGNFELYARFHDVRPDYQCATTYRALETARAEPADAGVAPAERLPVFRAAAPTARCCAPRWGRAALFWDCWPTRVPRACARRFWATIATPAWRRRCWPCAITPNSTPAFVSAWRPPNGGWNSAKKSPRTKTAIRAPPRTSCAMSTVRLKRPCAATRPTGSGSIAAGRTNPAMALKRE